MLIENTQFFHLQGKFMGENYFLMLRVGDLTVFFMLLFLLIQNSVMNS